MENGHSLKWRSKALIIFGLVAMLSFAVIFGLTAIDRNNRVQADAPISAPGGSNNPNGGPFGCTIANIAVFSNPSRIHVFCSAPVPQTTIQYFAAAGDSVHALATNRFLAILNTAYVLGKPVYIYYLDNTSNNPPGCQANDCRAIDWIFIVP